ncbi:hypothetical protein BSL78_06911 [Apostichopus japonicus]|uniref:Peptidase A2 domain-containing protein n=1 Tax=Stichopus japonicus TaxID=307972 RepID=A0A2G8L7D4_STIJA|nr:hypothetical protein BSL78_06911 [Apostichopus japonicus]
MLELWRDGPYSEELSFPPEICYPCRGDKETGKRGEVGLVGQRSTSPHGKPVNVPLSWKRLRSVGARGLYVQGELEGVKVSLLVDTGADLTVVRTGFFEQLSAKKTLELKDVSLDMAVADGRPLAFSGCGRLQLKVGSFAVEHEIWVADIDVDALLGYDSFRGITVPLTLGKGS